jgi:hypothetical protein
MESSQRFDFDAGEMLEREESSWQETDLDWEQQSASDVFQRLRALEEDFMNLKLLTGATIVAALSLPMPSHAQSGAAAGATTGAVTGAVVGGPVGAAVGAAVGAVAGGIADDSRPRFRSYVSEFRSVVFRHIAMSARFASARTCCRAASPITKCRVSMA